MQRILFRFFFWTCCHFSPFSVIACRFITQRFQGIGFVNRVCQETRFCQKLVWRKTKRELCIQKVPVQGGRLILKGKSLFQLAKWSTCQLPKSLSYLQPPKKSLLCKWNLAQDLFLHVSQHHHRVIQLDLELPLQSHRLSGCKQILDLDLQDLWWSLLVSAVCNSIHQSINRHLKYQRQ